MLRNNDIFTLYQEHSSNLRNQVQILISSFLPLIHDIDIQHGYTSDNCLRIIIKSANKCEEIFQQWKEMRDEVETKNKMLYLKVQDLELNLRAKNKCLQKFKEDLSSISIQVENLKYCNKKLTGSLDKYNKDMDHLKISEQWFKNQLTLCQTEKNDIKSKLITKEIDITRMLLTKEVEKPDKDKVSKRETSQITCNNATQTDYCGEQNITMLKLLQENYTENYSLQQIMQQEKHNLSDTLKIIANLEEKCYLYEKSVQQTNSTMNTLEALKKQLCEKLIISTESGKNKNLQLLNLIQDVDNLKKDILQQRLEKENVEIFVFQVNEKFIKIKTVHESLRKELENKDVVIQNLQNENNRLIVDNQRLKEMEFGDKKKIQDLLKSVENVELEKQEMSAVHYEEMCKFAEDMKTTQNELQEKHRDNIQLLGELAEKNSLIVNLTEKQATYQEQILSMQDKLSTFTKERNILSKIFKELYSDDNVGNNLDNLERVLSEEIGMKIIQIIKENRINNKKLREIFPQQLQEIEKRLSRLSRICCENEIMCSKLTNIDVLELLGKFKWLKHNLEVKRNEKMDQRRRFEKYNRILLAKVKEYKKLYLLSQEHTDYLQNVCNSFRSKQQLIQLSEDNKKIELPNNELTTSSIELVVNSDTIKQNSSDSLQDTQHSMDNFEIQNHELLLQNDQTRIELESIQYKHSECCSENSDLLSTVAELTHEINKKITIIKELEAEIAGNKLQAMQLSNNLSENVKLLEESSAMRTSIQKKLEGMNVLCQQNKLKINRLKLDKLNLHHEIMRRDKLFGKLFMAFKMRIDNIRNSVNDKFFLQRLCSDLKSALRLHTDQNKILRHVLQNRSFDTIDVLNSERQMKFTDNYIRDLVKKAHDFNVMESCQHVHSHIKCIREEVILIQNTVSKK